MDKLLGLPPNYAAHGAEIDYLIFLVHMLMLLLFVGWTTFFTIALIRFRSSKNKKGDYAGVKSKSSKYLEIAVAVVEAALLLGFSIPIYAKRVSNFPPQDQAVTARVIAEQFAWNIHYPGPDGIFGKTSKEAFDQETNPIGLDRSDPNAKDDVTTINQLHLPVGKPAILKLSSKDVIHCVNLPQMRIKQDTIPGMEIPVWFEPTGTGNFEIACAQLCGLGHYRMKGFLTVESQEDFDAWMQEKVAEAAAEDEAEDFWGDED